MSSKTMSPTATLLRNSRLFSLPPPLPRPLNDLMGHVQSNRTSDTATLPYPIQQAIATTPSALGRGDWGLKRALPLRSTTNTSIPLLRVNAVDTREHITDFDSASDLTLTLQKFQELNLPITVHPSRTRSSASEPRFSVFESALDNTDPKFSGYDAQRKQNKRWKYHGPWTAGMNQGEFEVYVKKEVGRRKGEFMAWLKAKRLKEMQRTAKADAQHEGRDLEAAAAKVEVSEEDLANYIKKLRADDMVLGQPLAEEIGAFLDLPTLPSLQTGVLSTIDESQGPPRTHPSAGLSYLKSDAYLDNHPILGPLARHPPVEARILVGVGAFGNTQQSGKVGVAGVAATAPRFNNPQSKRIRSVPTAPKDGLDQDERAERGREEAGGTLGIDVDGGNRIWVDVTAAAIDSRGRIDLSVYNPEMQTVQVHTGQVAEAPQEVKRTMQLPSLVDYNAMRESRRPRTVTGEAQRNATSNVLDLFQEGEMERRGRSQR